MSDPQPSSALPSSARLSSANISDDMSDVSDTSSFGDRYRVLIARLFSGIFHALSATLVLMSGYWFIAGVLAPEGDLVSLIIKVINTLVIALAMYELGVGVGKEYSAGEEGGNIFENIRRTITRFVGTVCIALVLESLMMIIKYSQLDLAGNLYYPVAILVACALLLLGLGGFLALTQNSCRQN